MANKKVELAWAAGFYDGEGCTYVARNQQHGKEYRYLSLSVGQQRREPLDRFAEAVGYGNVTGPHRDGAANGLTHRWRISGRKADYVLDALYPFLSSPKREQADRVRKEVEA